eukprot:scaffold147800_cov21-Tisochrysis_lutea.AAC.2
MKSRSLTSQIAGLLRPTCQCLGFTSVCFIVSDCADVMCACCVYKSYYAFSVSLLFSSLLGAGLDWSALRWLGVIYNASGYPEELAAINHDQSQATNETVREKYEVAK